MDKLNLDLDNIVIPSINSESSDNLNQQDLSESFKDLLQDFNEKLRKEINEKLSLTVLQKKQARDIAKQGFYKHLNGVIKNYKDLYPDIALDFNALANTFIQEKQYELAGYLILNKDAKLNNKNKK